MGVAGVVVTEHQQRRAGELHEPLPNRFGVLCRAAALACLATLQKCCEIFPDAHALPYFERVWSDEVMIIKVVLEKSAALFEGRLRVRSFFSLARAGLLLSLRQGRENAAGAENHNFGNSLWIIKGQSYRHTAGL